MNEDKDNIVEVEVTAEKINEPSKKQPSPKKPLDYYRKQIYFYSRLAALGLRYGPTGLVLSGLAALVFAILQSQNPTGTIYPIILIICYVLLGLFALLCLVGLFAFYIGRHYQKKDPAYSEDKQ